MKAMVQCFLLGVAAWLFFVYANITIPLVVMYIAGASLRALIVDEPVSGLRTEDILTLGGKKEKNP